MTNNQLRYIILAGLFTVPFIPLVVATSLFFPFITGKAFLFRLIVEVVFALWLILAIRDRDYRPKFSWVLVAVGAFLFFMALADIFALNPTKAFWSNYERMEGFLGLLHFAAYFLVLGCVLKTENIWHKLLATSLGASAIMAIYSFFQLAGKITINQGGSRVDGTFGNATYLAIYMVFHVFFAAILFLKFKNKWPRIILGLVTLMNLVVLYFTATRGAILGLLGGVFVAFVYLLLKSNKGEGIRKFALGGLLFIVVVVGIFLGIKNTKFVMESPVLSRFATLSFSQLQTQGRYYVWPMAWEGFREKPILGWGQEGFNFVFNKYYNPKMYGQEPWFDRAHSTPLDFLIAGGALGFLSYASIFLAILYYIFKSREEALSKENKAVLLGLVSAYVFNNIFVFDQIGSYILFFMVLGFVHAHAPEREVSLWDKISLKFRNIFEKENLRGVFESSILILLCLIVYFIIYVPWRNNKALLEVLRIDNQGQVGKIEVYERPLSRSGLSFPESLEHIAQASINVALNPAHPAELKEDLFEVVDRAFKKQIEKVPEDARYRLFYGNFLSRFGWYGKSVEQLTEALKLSPNKQGIAFELANTLLLDGKPLEALAIAKQTYEVEPSFEEAKIFYGLLLLASGDKISGEKILSEVSETKIIFDNRYLSILLSLKQNEKIIEIAKKRIALDPGNMDHRITLAAAYLEANRRGEAILVLEEMIKLDPSFKEKGEFYIKEIREGRNP